MRPEKVSSSCLDENVCLDSCRKYFSHDAWVAVQSVVDTIRKNPVFYCGRCSCPIADNNECSIVCECCLTWYHFKCLSYEKAPKSRLWFCQDCHQ